MPEKLMRQEITQSLFGIYQTKTPPASLNKRFWSVLHNLTLLRGMLHTRPGLRRITGLQLGSGSDRTVYAMNIFPGSGSTADRFITVTGSTLQSVPYNGGDPTTLTDALPSGYGAFTGVSPTSMVHLNNQLHIVNSSSANRKFNGTSVTRMGLVAPSSLAAPSLSAGALTLTRNYRATLVARTLDGSGESEPTAVTAVTYAAEQGTFSAPTVPSSDPQVDRWNLYGEVAGVYYRVNTTPVTLATTIVDNLADAALATGTAMEALGTNAVPPGNFSSLLVHQGRLLGTIGTNVLYYSDIGLDAGGLYAKPHAWPSANLITFPDTGGNAITALASFFEWLIVFQRSGIWAVRGDIADETARTISPLFVAPEFQGVGVPNQGCVRLLDNKLILAAKDEGYVITRDDRAGVPDLIVNSVSNYINQLWQQIDFSTGTVSVADRDNNRWAFVGRGNT